MQQGFGPGSLVPQWWGGMQLGSRDAKRQRGERGTAAEVAGGIKLCEQKQRTLHEQDEMDDGTGRDAAAEQSENNSAI